MKNLYKIFSFVLLLFITSNISAQSSWVTVYYDFLFVVRDIFFTTPQTGYLIVNNNSIYKTTNGGYNWNKILEHQSSIEKITFVNESTGFAVGHNTSSNPNQWFILKTSNQGNSWDTLLTNYFDGDKPDEIHFINSNTGWINGPNTKVLKTVNGGLNWQEQVINVANYYAITSFYPVNENVFKAALNTGWNEFMKTSNGGINWEEYQSGARLGRLQFNNENTGFVSRYNMPGYGAPLNKTTNGGINWFTIYNKSFSEVTFINGNTGWLVSADSVFRTTNGGFTWTKQVLSTFEPPFYCFGIFFINDKTGYLTIYESSGRDYILKTTNGGEPIGIKPISENIPGEYLLSQNYPNPFNPSTTIEFDLSKTSFTKLTVYDLTGRVVTVLVNEDLKAGSYRVNFESSNLSSGIYFYRIAIHSDKLETSDFVQTRKMVLIK